MSELQLFNIRVYGLLINEDNQILITDEYRMGKMITKFPGGGLESGEGLVDCLTREWMEETGQVIEVDEHFYTTDFYVPSAFNPLQQVISIFYKVKAMNKMTKPLKYFPFDFEEMIEGSQIFRWVDLDIISPADFTFPIEKKVASLLNSLNQ